MILLQPNFVNRDLFIYFGTRDTNFLPNGISPNDTLDQISKVISINKFVLMEQVHSTNIKEIIKPKFKSYKGIFFTTIRKSDGIYTKQRGIALSIKTADCIPVFIVAEGFIAAIHMGWRGAQKRIVENFIKLHLYPRHIQPNRIFIFAGPHIRSCCYEIRDDVRSEFKNSNHKMEKIFLLKDNKIYMNLEASLFEQAEACDIPYDNIHCIKICTSCLNELFYSHRKGDKGRNISIIFKKIDL